MKHLISIIFSIIFLFAQNAYALPGAEDNFELCLESVYKVFKDSLIAQQDILNDFIKKNDSEGAGNFIRDDLNKRLAPAFKTYCSSIALASIEKYLADNKLDNMVMNLSVPGTNIKKLPVPISKATFEKLLRPNFLIIFSSSIKNYKTNDIISKEIIYNNGNNPTDRSSPDYINEKCTKLMINMNSKKDNYIDLSIVNRSPDLLYYASIGSRSVTISTLSDTYDQSIVEAKDIFKKIIENGDCKGIRAYLAVAKISTSTYQGIWEDIDKIIILDNLGYK